jgi:hypothetical protein
MHYLVYQYEQGESGTHHYQGYVELKKRTTFPNIKTLLGSNTIHLEPRKGTAEQAADYCKKEEGRLQGPWEHGTPKPTQQGKRNDIKVFAEAVKSGNKRKRDMLEDFPAQMARFPKFYDMLQASEFPERVPPKVYLLIGPAGSGKTRAVYEATKDSREHFWRSAVSNGVIWFDGYDRHRDVLFDDFAGAANKMPLVNLLQLLDRYPIQVPVKGSHVWWTPERIFITTNIFPREWYKWEGRGEQYRALARRFTAVIDFYEMEANGDPPVGDNNMLPYLHEEYIIHGMTLVPSVTAPRS